VTAGALPLAQLNRGIWKVNRTCCLARLRALAAGVLLSGKTRIAASSLRESAQWVCASRQVTQSNEFADIPLKF
jgi:hypothetical protein